MKIPLMDEVLITDEINPVSSSTVKNGTGVDVSGWAGVLFILNIGLIAATGVVNGKIQRDGDSGFSDPTDLTPAMTALADSDDNQFFIFNVPTEILPAGEKFARIVVTPSVAAALLSAVAIRYRREGGLPQTAVADETIKVTA